ncbi:uncharacterized protein LOC143028037 [Oratosquilla oratoria]|uniref:uncharacterized protein LOC143028037 n=1 Tax=Oratosquilla oratoria TaxID=337810 RepID=UPI003F77332D
MEDDRKLHFLDTIIIHHDEKGVNFSVYRKPTSKDDFIRYLSQHSTRAKSRVVIGFFLWALRMCSKEYIEIEMNHTFNIFHSPLYPAGLLTRLKKRAKEIHEKSKGIFELSGGTTYRKRRSPDQLIIQISHPNSIFLRTLVKDIIRYKVRQDMNVNSKIYSIPCSGCPATYNGETSREWKRD